jgi:Flp pilus assembly pilin Flp
MNAKFAVIARAVGRHWTCFRTDNRGATAIEYSVVAAGIAVAVAATVFNLGAAVRTTLFERLLANF